MYKVNVYTNLAWGMIRYTVPQEMLYLLLFHRYIQSKNAINIVIQNVKSILTKNCQNVKFCHILKIKIKNS